MTWCARAAAGAPRCPLEAPEEGRSPDELMLHAATTVQVNWARGLGGLSHNVVRAVECGRWGDARFALDELDRLSATMRRLVEQRDAETTYRPGALF